MLSKLSLHNSAWLEYLLGRILRATIRSTKQEAYSDDIPHRMLRLAGSNPAGGSISFLFMFHINMWRQNEFLSFPAESHFNPAPTSENVGYFVGEVKWKKTKNK